MSKIVALIVVQSKTKSALVLPQVISHEVRVLGQVYRFQCQAPQALSSVNSLQGTPGSAPQAVLQAHCLWK